MWRGYMLLRSFFFFKGFVIGELNSSSLLNKDRLELGGN